MKTIISIGDQRIETDSNNDQLFISIGEDFATSMHLHWVKEAIIFWKENRPEKWVTGHPFQSGKDCEILPARKEEKMGEI